MNEQEKKDRIEEIVPDIGRAALRSDFVVDLIEAQSNYLQEHDRYPVSILMSSNLLIKLFQDLKIEDSDTLIPDLVSKPRYLFHLSGLPTFLVPGLKKMEAMVVAEPRFWKTF